MSFRLAFLGASHFGRRCLERAAGLPGCQVAGVLTAPERFSISYNQKGVRNCLFADLGPAAVRLGAALHLLDGKMTDPALLARVRAWQPDVILAVGWYHMVPRAMRAMAPAVGLHASLLPDYSGGAPLVWAMINGEERTGITLFRLADGVDNGPVIGQAEEEIRPDDTIATLYARIEEHGLRLVERFLPSVAAGTAPERSQDESRRRVFPQRSPADGRINWHWPAPRIHDFVRAQTKPYPGAFTSCRGRLVTVWRTRPASHPAAAAPPSEAPGMIVASSPLMVGCGDGGCLELQEWGPRDTVSMPSTVVPSLNVGTCLD